METMELWQFAVVWILGFLMGYLVGSLFKKIEQDIKETANQTYRNAEKYLCNHNWKDEVDLDVDGTRRIKRCTKCRKIK